MTKSNSGPPPGFAMVPAWMLWRGLDANELLVYAHLAVFGTFNTGWQVYEECRPSKQTLADGGEAQAKHCGKGKDCDRACGVYHGTGLSVSTVYRALRGLDAKGIAEGEERYDPVTKAQLPTVYRLTYNNPGVRQPARHNPHDIDREPEPADGPPVTHDRGLSVMGDRGPLSPMTDNPEPPTQNQKTQKKSKTKPSGTVGAGRTAVTREAANPAEPEDKRDLSSKKVARRLADRKPSPTALTMLAQLPRDWTATADPADANWVRRQVAVRLDKAITTPIEDTLTDVTITPSPAAVVAILTLNGTPDHFGAGNHLPALDHLPALLARAVLSGAICPTCGHRREQSDGWHHCADGAAAWVTHPRADSRGAWQPAPDRPNVTQLSSWVANDDMCVSCETEPGTVRPGLPLPVPVCDGCLTTASAA